MRCNLIIIKKNHGAALKSLRLILIFLKFQRDDAGDIILIQILLKVDVVSIERYFLTG